MAQDTSNQSAAWGENDKPVPTAQSKQDQSWGAGDAPVARGLKGWGRDIAATAVKGAIAVPELAVGLADIATGGEAGKLLENADGAVGFRPKQAKEMVNQWHSDATLDAQRKFQEADGIVDKAVTAVQNPSLVATAVGESLPTMGAGGVAARGLMTATKLGQMGAKGAAVAGAIGEGVAMAGSAAEQIRQESEDGLLTPGQTAAAVGTGAAGTLIGVGGARLAQRLGIGDVDTMLAQGQKGLTKELQELGMQQRAAKSIPRQVIEGAIAEGLLEELPQSVAEQVFQNIALGKPWYEDVDSAVVLGTLSGGAMGAGAAGYRAVAARGFQPAATAPETTAAQPASTGDGSTPPSSPGLERVRQAYAAQLQALQQQEQGETLPAQTTPPDGAAVLAYQRRLAEQYRQSQLAASRAVTGPDDEILESTGATTRVPPSVAAGLNPAAQGLEGAAALAVDTGAARTVQAQTRAQSLREAIDPETGEVKGQFDMAGWSDQQLSDVFKNAQSKEVRRQLAMELSRRRTQRTQAELQQELQAELTAPEFPANADSAFAQVREDAGPVPDDIQIQGAAPRRAATPQKGQNNAPQADQAQQAETQPAQAGGAPAGVAGRAAAAGGAQGAGAVSQGPAATPVNDAGARIGSAGAAWTRMPAVERQAVAARLPGVKPIVRSNLAGARWENLNSDLQAKIADAIAPAAATAMPPLMKGTETAGTPAADARWRTTYEYGSKQGRVLGYVRSEEGDRVRFMADDGETVDLPPVALMPVQRADSAEAVADAAHEAATSPLNDLPQPTEAQKEAGNYKKGHVIINGLDISIENAAGTRRRPEWPPLAHHYGYFKGSVGADKDHVDVFLTDRAGDASLPVFVVDQVNKDGSFDEHKAVMGTATEEEARAAYLDNYERGWTGLGAIKQMTLDEFKAWVMDPAKTSKPVALPRGVLAKMAQARQAQAVPPPSTAMSEEEFAANLDAYVVQYRELAARREGNPDYYGTDLAKELFPEYGTSIESRRDTNDAVQPRASIIAFEAFKARLAEPKTQEQATAFLMAGGPGSGKTTLRPDHGIVYDSTSSSLVAARRNVKLILDSGRDVEYRYVFTEPESALRAAIKRGQTQAGRQVSLNPMVSTHTGAYEVVQTLMRDYAGNERVSFFLFNNTGFARQQIDSLPPYDYNGLRERLTNILDQEHAEGRVSAAEYRAITGNAPAARSDQADSRSGSQATQDRRPEQSQGLVAPSGPRQLSTIEPAGTTPVTASRSPAGALNLRDKTVKDMTDDELQRALAQATGEMAKREPKIRKEMKQRGITPDAVTEAMLGAGLELDDGVTPGKWIKKVSGLNDVMVDITSGPGEPVRARVRAMRMGGDVFQNEAEGLPAILENIEKMGAGLEEYRRREAAKTLLQGKKLTDATTDDSGKRMSVQRAKGLSVGDKVRVLPRTSDDPRRPEEVGYESAEVIAIEINAPPAYGGTAVKLALPDAKPDGRGTFWAAFDRVQKLNPPEPESSFSETPDFSTTWPRPQETELNQAGRDSMFVGIPEDELLEAVIGVVQETGFGLQSTEADVKALIDGLQRGIDPATGKPAKPARLDSMQKEVEQGLYSIDSTLADFQNEFGVANTDAFRAAVLPALDDLRQSAASVTTGADAPGTRQNGEIERAAAERLDKLYAQMGNITNRNSREGNAKAAVRSVIDELRKPRTVSSVEAMLEKAASDLAQKYGAFSGVISEVVETLQGQNDELDAEMRSYEAKAARKDADRFAGNTLFTADKVAAARARMRKKLGTLNSGIDPELLVDGMTIAGAYIESGVRNFSQYAKAMIEDMGEGVKPYLLSFWEGARNYPGLESKGMTSPADSAAQFAELNKVAIEAATAPDDVRSNARAAGLAATDGVFQWTTKQSTRANVKAAILDSLTRSLPDSQMAGAEALADEILAELASPDHAAAAIGKVVAKPAKRSRKTGAKGDMTLTQDWGVEAINGYGDSTREEGNATKDAFLKEARQYLGAVAEELAKMGYEPHPERNGKPGKAVRVNESGTATSGEVSLTVRHPGTGANLYLHVGDTALRGMFPSTPSGIAIMGRVSTARGDTYATKGMNQWLPVDLSAADLAGLVLSKARAIIESSAASQATTSNASPLQPEQLSAERQGRAGEVAAAGDGNPQPVDAGLAQARESADRGRGTDAAADRTGAEGARGVQPAGEPASGPSRDRGAVRPERRGTGPVSAQADPATAATSSKPELDPPAAAGDADFTIEAGGIGKGGLTKKYRDNIAAIRILKAMAAEQRQATPAERRQIAQYVGWGALKGVFDKDNQQWSKEFAELRELLTDAEYKAARASVLNAHYTSPDVVGGIFQAVERLGFQHGRVLEPSVGVGNFFGLMPAGMRKASQLHGVELDPLTSQIVAALYPSAKIARATGFQDFDVPGGYFDLAIGNPPFGSEPIVDDARSPYSGASIHNYFFAKSIDKLRPGGLLAMVVSHSFLDAKTDTTRRWIAERANLVSAVRLPRTAFKENAGTEVVTDILIFQRKTDAEQRNGIGDDSWVKVGQQTLTDAKTGQDTTHSVSQYFLSNPDKVLGTPTAAGSMYRAGEYTVDPSGDLAEQLKAWAEKLPAGTYQAIERTHQPEAADVSVPDGVKVGSYFVADDGKVMLRGEDQLGERTATAWAPPNAKALGRMKGMVGLRDALRTQMRLERSPDATEDQIEANRAQLAERYDAFQKAFGYLNDPTNRRLFLDDTEAPLLLALEFDYDRGVSKAVAESEGIETRAPSAVKADILKRRVLFPPADNIKVSTAKDALLASLNYKGTLDIAYMAQLYDKPQDEIVAELGDVVFMDPMRGLVMADEYLSGDVKTKLAEAEAAALDNPELRRNVEALKKVIPEDKKPSEIHASMGAAFIPPEYFEQFAKEVTGADATVRYVRATGQWMVSFTGEANQALNSGKWGIVRMPAAAIFIRTMAGQGVVVTETYKNVDGGTTTVVLEKETAAAREKQAAMKAEWQRWIWADPDRADRVAAIYNDTMNRIVPRTYDGSHLTFPGMSPAMELLPHQKNAVWRVLQSRQMLADHVVGAGKTFEVVAAFMEMRRLGIARKPFIAVPNHLTLQWRSEFSRLYPAANVLAATPEDFAKGNREKFFSKIVTGDWDAVIVGHSSLKRIALPIETEKAILGEQVDEISAAIEDMKRSRGDRNIVRDMEGIKARLEARMKARMQALGERDKVVSFDDLGVDAFGVDELHEFKNLFYNSTMERVPGMGNPAGSDKAFDLFVKLQWMFDTYGEKAPIIGATGTPVSNSLVEMFNMQRFLQYPTLKRSGLHVFDAWAKQFGSVESLYEVAPSGTGYRQSSRFAKFKNLPALMAQYQTFADTVTLDDLKAQGIARGEGFPVPKVAGGRPQNVVAKRSPSVAAFMGVPQLDVDDAGKVRFGFNPETDTVKITPNQEETAYTITVTSLNAAGQPYDYHLGSAKTEEDARLSVVEAALSPKIKVDPKSILGQFADLKRLNKETKGKVNALSLTGQANKAGLDYRLINPSAPDFDGSKINLAVDRMMATYKKWTPDKGTQLVFCDLSVPLSARSGFASKERRVYVREQGQLVHKKGTLHTVKGHEQLPFFLVKEKAKDGTSFAVYDAATGLRLQGNLSSKAIATAWTSNILADEAARQRWIDARDELGDIEQDAIDDYNNANEIDTEETEAISLADIGGSSGASGFSVYDDIKTKLIARGVPEREIAFIHDYGTPAAKDKLFKQVKSGAVRFLLGSTPKMGAGTNVQDRLVALHHIDAPWRPSDLEQREGRIIRRGNVLYMRDPEGFEVEIYRYATEQTYDTRRWQILEHKARGIEQLRNYDGTLNEIDDIEGEAANSADMKAAASGDPLILEETKLRNDVRRLEALQSSDADERASMHRRARDNQRFADDYGPQQLGTLQKLKAAADANPVPKDEFAGLTVGGKRYTEREEAIKALRSAMTRVLTDDGGVEEIGYRGLDFTLEGDAGRMELTSPTGSLGVTWPKEESLPSVAGFLTRFANYINRLPAQIEDLQAKIEEAKAQAGQLRELAAKPFDQAQALVDAREAHKRVQRRLIAKGPDIPVYQRALLAKAMETQRAALREKGFGEALDEFSGARPDAAAFRGQVRAEGSPTDRAVMDMVREGRSAPDILSLVAGTSKSRFNRQVARLLLKTGVNPAVKHETGDLGSGGGFKFLAKYSRKNDAVSLTDGAQSQAEHIFMHETIHAATLRALDRKGVASVQMRKLYEHVKKQGGAAGQYGMKNVGEFVAEVFTNHEFQRAIKDMSAPRGNSLKTAWDAFVRILRGILGLPQDSTNALSQALELGVAVMREDMALRRRGAAKRSTFDAHAGVYDNLTDADRQLAKLFGGPLEKRGAKKGRATDELTPADLVPQAGTDQTNTPAFRKWFGDSKVVDAQGKPLVVYHGTRPGVEIKEFRARNENDGIYFTPDPLYAEGFTEEIFGDSGAKGAIYPSYLSVKNPLIVRADDIDSPEAQRFLYRGHDRAELERNGHDGAMLYLGGELDQIIAFRPEQIKSATGNAGTFDPEDPDISYFGTADLAGLKSSALDQIQQVMSHPGKVSLWDKTVGTMRNLAERAPAFKPVFDSAQRYLDDVSMLGNDTADHAPRLLPRVESWRDLTKKPITPEENKAIARPLFEGTLMWGRDFDGQAVLVSDLEGKYRQLPAMEKVQILLRYRRIDERVAKMWQGLPLELYEKTVNTAFENRALKAGVVWTDDELKSIFKLDANQIGLYREARAAIDRSIDMTTRADMMRALGDEYAAMRDAVLDQPTLDDARALLVQTLKDDAQQQPDNADRITDLIQAVELRYEKATELRAQGYAPLSRFGRYTVDVVDAAGERQYFGMFETMREANQMALRMKAEFGARAVTQGTMSAESYKLFAGITPESLEMFGDMLGLDSKGDEAKDRAFQAYLQLAKNNHSALKRLIHRKGIAGFSEDVGRVLASFAYSNARLGAGALNAGTIENAINAIPKEQGELKDLAVGLRDYIHDPQEEGQAVRGMLFAQYLGGSLASAFVNTTQPFSVTIPWLSQYGGIRKASAQMARALNDMRRSMTDKGFKYEKALADALHHAEADGVVSPQEIHQLMAQARGTGALRTGDGTRAGDLRAAAGNKWEKLKVLWGQPFALAEQFNRRSTFIAAFRLAQERGITTPAEFARRAVLETQFLYSKANKMRFARGAIGGTLMTFKTYSVSYLELMHRMWTQGGPEGKRAVGWAVVMLLLMGGAGGLPFMEDAEDLIDGAGQLMGYNLSTKQWRKELLGEVVGKEFADFMENGVSGLPGAPIDVSGRLGMGNLIPGTGLLLSKQNRERDLLEVAGPAGDLVARGFTGGRKVLTGDVVGAALEVSPTAVRNAAQGIDMAVSGIYKDRKGYKVIDTTLDEAASKFLGFQPKSVAQTQESAGFMLRSKSFYIQTSAEIKAQWADALFRKDEAALQRVRQRLADWNEKNPEQRIVVKMPDVWKRVREMGKDREERIAATAPKALRQQMREITSAAN